MLAEVSSEKGGWPQFLRQLAHLSAVAAPVALAVAALLGYYSGAIYLSWRFLQSVWLGLGLMILQALLRPWLLILVRRRALREARRRAAQAAERSAGAPEPGRGVGDAVTVGEASGLVTRIQMRATTITDWDHKELIVPNKRFITGEVLNWTLSDSVIRLTLPISVAHGSNSTVVRDTLVRIAAAQQGVAREPPPSAYFRGLGPSSMDFELSVFVRREDYGRVLHELNSSVEETLVAKGLSIATPIQLQQIQVRATGDGAPAT